MKHILGFTVAMATLTTLNLASAGDVTGTVTLKGTPPPEKEIVEISKDANCGPLHSTVPKTRFFVVGSKGELADVVVSIKGVTGKSAGESAAAVEIDQNGCEYLPYVSAVQTKQKIVVKNSDPVLHNIHTVPANPANLPEQNKAQMPKGADLTFSFQAPEDFLKFKCDVHPWMFAYVSVFDHPYFSVSGKDGGYKIANLAPGKYTVEARHRKGGTVTKEIEVKDGENKLDLEIELK
jgi:plastocyanin